MDRTKTNNEDNTCLRNSNYLQSPLETINCESYGKRIRIQNRSLQCHQQTINKRGFLRIQTRKPIQKQSRSVIHPPQNSFTYSIITLLFIPEPCSLSQTPQHTQHLRCSLNSNCTFPTATVKPMNFQSKLAHALTHFDTRQIQLKQKANIWKAN